MAAAYEGCTAYQKGYKDPKKPALLGFCGIGKKNPSGYVRASFSFIYQIVLAYFNELGPSLGPSALTKCLSKLFKD